MTEPAPVSAPRWSAAALLLALLLALLVIVSAVILVRGPQTPVVSSVVPAHKADADQARTLAYDDVSAAAQAWTSKFMKVDYKRMDPLIQAVLDASTDPFKSQYQQARVRLKALVQDNLTTSTGKVLSVGVGEVGDSQAVVFVAADSTVRNKSTKAKAAPRYYRLKLTLDLVGHRWLTSNVEFVG